MDQSWALSPEDRTRNGPIATQPGYALLSGIETLDPFFPAPPRAVREAGTPGGPRPAQRARRARILAAARTLIANGGLEYVTIRDVADISKLSIQTIYNLVGNRAQLVEAAVSEFILMTAQHAASLKTYPNVFLALADLIWVNAARNPEYTRAATIGCNGHALPLYGNIRERNARSLRRLLNRHYMSVARDRGVDLNMIAIHITALVGAMAVEWARGMIDLAEFRYRLASAYGTLLVGLVSSEEFAAINQWLAAIRVPPPRFGVA